MKYVNRRGDVYYLFQGVTKTGKPKYFISRKTESNAGVRIDSLPSDFELFESPIDSKVSVRKRIPSCIDENELKFVQERTNATAKNLKARVICEGSFISIYVSESLDDFKSIASEFGGLPPQTIAIIQASALMSPAFRFKLVREEERVFEVQRYCFRGSIDDWISLHHEGTLDELCRVYLVHLGKESFYELI